MLPPDLIERLSAEAIRIVSLDLVAETVAASQRLDDATDTEALHDFRVGLRRLRSTLAAYKDELAGCVRRKHRRQLREVAAQTGGARDAEVQLAWLESCATRLSPAQRAAAEWLARGLRARARRAYAQVRGPVRLRFDELVGPLREALATYESRLDDDGEATFAAAAADHLEVTVATLDASLAEVRSAEDVETAHRARIEAKRLRYLLEPLRGDSHVDATPAVKALKRLQDVLGELHDAHVVADVLARALVRASARTARQAHAAIYAGRRATRTRGPGASGLRPGLIALDRLNRDRRDALFAHLVDDWLAPGDRALRPAVLSLIEALRRHAAPSRAAPGRRFLLAGVPELAASTPSTLVETGFLPGKKLHEWLRRVTGPSGIALERCVEQGAGLRRTAVVEEPPQDLFARLWPLTAQRRLVLRRHTVSEAESSWTIDEVVGQGLVIASVRLPRGHEASIPDWMRPQLGAEVTDDPRYDDLALARPAARRGRQRPTRRARATGIRRTRR